MSSPADYRHAAKECRQKAADAHSEHERRSYLGMAARREQMAEDGDNAARAVEGLGRPTGTPPEPTSGLGRAR